MPFSPLKTLDEIMDLANKYGIDALEVRGINSVMDNLEIPEFSEQSADKTKNILAERGIKLYSLGTSCSFHSPEKRDDMVKAAKENILVAKRMGFPYIRVFGNNLIGDKETCIERVGGALAELSDYAAEQGVTVLLEIHGDYNRIETVAPVLNIVGNRKGFGLIWDVAHSDRAYGENWQPFYEFIRPYIKHVHLKDHNNDEVITLPGEGRIPLVPIVKRLLDDGYDGYFSLEWEKKWSPEIGNVEPALDKLIDLLSEF